MTASVDHASQRRAVSKPRHHRPWTRAEDELLRFEWGSARLGDIARKLGRTKRAVYWRAAEVLKLSSVPAGFETLNAAAIRTGFERRSLRRILEAHGADIIVLSGAGIKAKRGTKQCIVSRVEVDDAVADWCASETPESAAKRCGVSATTLRQWLRDAGHESPFPGAIWRVPTRVIDEVVAQRRPEGRNDHVVS